MLPTLFSSLKSRLREFYSHSYSNFRYLHSVFSLFFFIHSSSFMLSSSSDFPDSYFFKVLQQYISQNLLTSPPPPFELKIVLLFWRLAFDIFRKRRPLLPLLLMERISGLIFSRKSSFWELFLGEYFWGYSREPYFFFLNIVGGGSYNIMLRRHYFPPLDKIFDCKVVMIKDTINQTLKHYTVQIFLKIFCKPFSFT